MSSRKWMTMLSIITILLGTLLTACSDKTSDEGDGDSGKKKEIDFFISASTKPDADRYVKELEDLSGYKLNFKYVSDYDDKLTTLFASGGDMPDVVQATGILDPALKGAVDNGAFMDLTELIDKYGKHIKENVPEEMWKSPRVSKDGKIYALPRPSHDNIQAIFVRKDWLDQLDMDVPETLDDWLEYYKAIKENNMNGNGDSNDEYGLYTRDSKEKEMFFGAFGVYPSAWKMTGGKMIPDMITPEMKKALEFYRDLYKKDYVNDDMFTRENEDWINAIYGNKAGSWEVSVNDYLIAFSDERDIGNIPDDGNFDLVSAPEGPDGMSGLNPESDGISSVWVVPGNMKNAEDIVKYWDWAWSAEEATKFFGFGIKDHNYKEKDGKITYDPLAPANIDDFNSSLFHAFLNPRGTEHVAPRVLDAMGKKGEDVKETIKDADEHVLKNDAANMPTLEVFESNPELIPGDKPDSLFLEMFAKVVTGKEDLDSGFDKFVETWKKHGGDDAIKQATDWYNDYNKQ